MFVEALLPIGSAFDNLARQKGVYDDLQKKSELAQQKADTARMNAENRKRELDIVENGVRSAQVQNIYGGVHLQMQPVRAEEEE